MIGRYRWSLPFALGLFAGVQTLSADPTTWDSRLTDLGVYWVEANVAPGTWYWKLTSGVYQNENESGGNHNIYYKCLNAGGTPIENQKTWTAWPTGNPTNAVYQFTKGAIDGYWANFAMAGGWCPFWPEGPHGPYGAYVDGPSDEVWGMGMPCNRHVNYLYTWRWTQKTATQPQIERSPATLTPTATQGSSPADQTSSVRNASAGTLNYTITENQSWMDVSPGTGTSTGEWDTITVHYTTAALAPNTYTGTITITDPNATNNPQLISVTLTITPPPAPGIDLSTTMLGPMAEKGFDAPDDTFNVRNNGAGTLNYTITDNVAWLSIADGYGTGSSTGEWDTIVVEYHTASLDVGTYYATITVSDPAAYNDPRTIGVTLSVTPHYVAPDANQDGDVDLEDFAFLQLCFSGPNHPLPLPECFHADFDNDNDVDLADFGRFLACFNGPNRPPAAGCE